MAEQATQDKQPQPDPAEFNGFFPSRYSLSQFTSPKSDLRDADYATTYQGSKKILMIGADERYLLTDNGSFFSTGNHPVETLLPMYHLDKAGFAFDVATVSGNPVKFEFWAMPSEDETVKGFFDKYHPQFKQPLRLSSVLAQGLEQYAAIFVPGGHDALIGLPDSRDLGACWNGRPPTTGSSSPCATALPHSSRLATATFTVATRYVPSPTRSMRRPPTSATCRVT